MDRTMRRAVLAAVVAGGLGSAGCATTGDRVTRGAAPAGGGTAGCGDGGCAAAADAAGGHSAGECYRNWVDVCYPERYNRAARNAVLAPFAAQVNNGHVLNQTVWNWYFEPGTDVLTTAGAAKLDSIARTRPSPDPRLYLQVARDVPVTPQTLDTVAARRDELTARRAAVVRRYMAAQPAVEAVPYEVFVHDALVPGIAGDFATSAYRGQGQGYRGGIGGASGTNATSTGGGGPTPAASGIGTGPTTPTPGPAPAPAPNNGL